MIKAPISLQDLRKSLYVKAKAESSWRFWGLYVHVCKMETLQEAYQMAKSNDGAPGIDGVTFEVIEESGVESFLKQIRDELVHDTYQPMQVRKKEIPKDGGTKVRVLSISAIRDRVVQGHLSSSWSRSLKLIFNRGRMDTDQSGQLMKRCCKSTRRSWKGRNESSILVAKAGVGFRLPIAHSTVNVKTGWNKPPIAPLRKVLEEYPTYDRTSINAWEDVEFR